MKMSDTRMNKLKEQHKECSRILNLPYLPKENRETLEEHLAWVNWTIECCTKEKKEYWAKYHEKNREALSEKASMARCIRLKRVPSWLTEKDRACIKALYKNAKTRTLNSGISWHVDHIIPLRGKYVSGLHVPSNLRVVKAKTNLSKNNYFDIDKEWGLQA